MRNTGLRNPATGALICFAMFVGGAVSVWSGVNEMNALGGAETTSSAAKIGIGLLVGIMGFLFQFNFLWGVRVIGAMQRGDNEIARWTVSPHELAAFLKNDEAHNARGRCNDYTVPARAPDGGIEVIFSADGVLVGGTFFGLATTGLAHFRSVQVLREHPRCIEFDTALVWGSNVTVPRIHVSRGTLRIPISQSAAGPAQKVVAHYRDVVARKVIVKPNFWRWRIRLGLTTAIVSALVAAAGFGLEVADADLGVVPLVMAVAGTMLALGGLILAAIAWRLHVQQHRGGLRLE
jgi:hypothetical protein